MKILIGAPVFKREWILPYWLEAIEAQNFPLSQIGFIFEGAPDDEGTRDILIDWHSRHPEVWYFDYRYHKGIHHKDHAKVEGDRPRKWREHRYAEMVKLRNYLLDSARVLSPDRYFSLDTDILLEDPDTINHLIELTEETADAASPLMYMTPRTKKCPNIMSWIGPPGTDAVRLLDTYPSKGDFQVDVIMAGVMMSREVYKNIDYSWHRQGEDLGWSRNCQKAGYKLYCVPDFEASHIMSENMLEEYLQGNNKTPIK